MSRYWLHEGSFKEIHVEGGIGYFNWGDIRPFLACSQGHRAGLPTLRDSLSRGCSAPAEFCARWSGGWCEADVTTPQHALGALLAQAEASGAGEGPAPPGCWGGACILLSKDHSCIFRSTPTKMFYIF